MLILILGLVIFLGVHSVRIVAPGWREERRAAMGEGPWKGLYSLVALIGLVLLIWGYGLARQTAPILYEPPMVLKHIAVALMVFAFVFLGIFIAPAGRLKPRLRHPMLIAVKTWAVAHLLANGDLASILLFGSFLIWAVADRISVKRRPATADTAVHEAGPATNDAIGIAIGVVLFVLFVWRLHVWLIGVSPIA